MAGWTHLERGKRRQYRDTWDAKNCGCKFDTAAELLCSCHLAPQHSPTPCSSHHKPKAVHSVEQTKLTQCYPHHWLYWIQLRKTKKGVWPHQPILRIMYHLLPHLIPTLIWLVDVESLGMAIAIRIVSRRETDLTLRTHRGFLTKLVNNPDSSSKLGEVCPVNAWMLKQKEIMPRHLSLLLIPPHYHISDIDLCRIQNWIITYIEGARQIDSWMRQNRLPVYLLLLCCCDAAGSSCFLVRVLFLHALENQ